MDLRHLEPEMLQKDLKVGRRYTAMVSGKLSVVRLDAVDEIKPHRKGGKTVTRFRCRNERTGKTVTFKSAAKFRGEAKDPNPTKTAAAKSALKVEESAVTSMQVKPEEVVDKFDQMFPNLAAKAKEEAAVVPAKKVPPKPRLKDNLTGTLKRGTPEANRKFSQQNAEKLASDLTNLKASVDGRTTYEIEEDELRADNGMPVYPDAGVVVAPKVGIAELMKSRSNPSPSWDGGTIAGYTPTDEQAEVLRVAQLVNSGGVKRLVIAAGAGAGKTSTLRMLEEVLTGLGQYTAFNKNLVDESRGKFRKASCNTTHSLAFKSVGRRYAHRLGGQRVRSHEVAKMLGIEPVIVTIPDPTGKLGEDGKVEQREKTLSPAMLAYQITKAMANFSQSADEAITKRHFKRIDGIDVIGEDGRRSRANQDLVIQHLMPFAQAAWEDVGNPSGSLPFTHDYYVKLWQLGKGQDSPVIQAGYILLDEGQDTAPVFLDVLKRQSCPLIIVGDQNQIIYEWRGAIDAMSEFTGSPRYLLSQSFRFGQAIADVANSVLRGLEEPTDLVMRGLPDLPSVVILPGGDPPPPADAILCRTNAKAVGHVITAAAEGRKAHLIGGGSDVVAFVKAAADLQANRPTFHMDLCCFESWTEVQEYVKEDEGEDLKLIVKLIDEFGVKPILSAIEHMPAEADADLVISTAHKSKGREWNRVKLASDFPPAGKMGDSDRRLLYVACTRAKHVLDLTECSPFLPGEDEEGNPVQGLKVTFTTPTHTLDELDTYLATKAEERADQSDPEPEPVRHAIPQPGPTPAAGTGSGQPAAFSWTSLGNNAWGVRGPAGHAFKIVMVRKKDGSESQVNLGEVAADTQWSTTYHVRR